MRWYISYPVLGAGLVFAVDTFFPSAPAIAPPAEVHETEASFDPGPVVVSASEIAEEPGLHVARFSPGAVLLDAKLPSEPSTTVFSYLAEALLPSEPVTDDEIVPTAPVAVAEWRSAIVREPTPAATRVSAAQEATARTRAALARDIQSELQRLGCYSGKIDGVWGGASRRAILSFMDRVNATLPTQEPDVFMLSLVRGQSSAVCGVAPETIVADNGSRYEPTMARGVSDPRPPLYGRMGIGGPRPDDSLGATSVTGLTVTAQRKPDTLARTAALEAGDPGVLTPSDLPVVEDVARSSSFDNTPPPQMRRRKPSSATAKVKPPKRSRASRHVQRLFTHPLGQM